MPVTMLKTHLYPTTYLLVLLTLIACSTSSRHDIRHLAVEEAQVSGAKLLRDDGRLQWDLWAYERDLDGMPLRDLNLLQGDRLSRQGQLELALDRYKAALGRRLSSPEERAAIMRIATTQLSLGRAKDSLETLGRYLSRNGGNVSRVDAPFGLVLGYAYGNAKVPEQSLAWFSRSYAMAGSNPILRDSVEQGIRQTLARVSEIEFEKTAKQWTDDETITRLFGVERKRRKDKAALVAVRVAPSEVVVQPNLQEPPIQTEDVAEKPIALVLLPLTGQYAQLGNATKKGMELALMDAHKGLIEFEFRDTGSDNTKATAGFEEAISSVKPTAVVGPLLSDAAVEVAEISRSKGIPIVHFSKREGISTGGGVFRLGLTTSSQMRSLIDAIHQSLPIHRVAIVYPNDQVGTDYANAFRKEATARGIEVVLEAPYMKGDDKALVAIAEQVDTLAPQAVFLPDAPSKAARFFSSIKPGVTIPLGIASWSNVAELKRSQAVLNNAIFVSPFLKDSKRPIVGKFIEAYKAQYGQEPDLLAAQGFDAATLALTALKRTADERVGFDSALLSIREYDGVTGRTEISSSGELERTYDTARFKDGVISSLVPTTESLSSASN